MVMCVTSREGLDATRCSILFTIDFFFLQLQTYLYTVVSYYIPLNYITTVFEEILHVL